VCEALATLVVQLRNLDEAIARLDRSIAKLAQRDETARRLMTIPGFGPITASAMAATIHASSFAGPREFAAYLGPTPKQNSSGGKPKLGRISKVGNRNLRKLLVVGAHAVLFHRKPHTDPLRMWAKRLIEKKPSNSSPWRSPTRWRASPSHSCGARRSIGKFRRKEYR
jgi:transposase